jgi:hypothetical protein
LLRRLTFPVEHHQLQDHEEFAETEIQELGYLGAGDAVRDGLRCVRGRKFEVFEYLSWN